MGRNLRGDARVTSSGDVEPLPLYEEVLRHNPEAFEYRVTGKEVFFLRVLLCQFLLTWHTFVSANVHLTNVHRLPLTLLRDVNVIA